MSIEETTFIATKEDGKYPIEAKCNAVAVFAATGNLREVSRLTKIPLITLQNWQKQDFWQTQLDEVKREKALILQSKLGALTELALEKVHDRLENGDFVLNNKTGKIVRKPVGIKEATKVLETSVTQALAVAKDLQQYSSEKSSVQDLLKTLAAEFVKYTKTPPTGEVVDVTFKEV